MVLDAVKRLPGQVWTYARTKPVTWLIENSLAACKFPKGEAPLRTLADLGVTLLVNLHERPHPTGLLAPHGLTEVHVPVKDFTAPTPQQIEAGVAAMEQAIAKGQRVAVHCGAGLGRTGTLLACYLVKTGLDPCAAIAQVRTARPGSVETSAQEAAIAAYPESLKSP